MATTALIRWVRQLGIYGMLSYVGAKLFGYDPGSDENQRKFEILLESHLRKLLGELFLQTEDFSELGRVYDFNQSKTRYHLLHRYCNAVENGVSDDIASICDEFISSLEENHKKAKDILNM